MIINNPVINMYFNNPHPQQAEPVEKVVEQSQIMQPEEKKKLLEDLITRISSLHCVNNRKEIESILKTSSPELVEELMVSPKLQTKHRRYACAQHILNHLNDQQSKVDQEMLKILPSLNYSSRRLEDSDHYWFGASLIENCTTQQIGAIFHSFTTYRGRERFAPKRSICMLLEGCLVKVLESNDQAKIKATFENYWVHIGAFFTDPIGATLNYIKTEDTLFSICESIPTKFESNIDWKERIIRLLREGYTDHSRGGSACKVGLNSQLVDRVLLVTVESEKLEDK